MRLLHLQLEYKNHNIFSAFRALKNADSTLIMDQLIEVYELYLKYKKLGYKITFKQMIEIYKEIKKNIWENDSAMLNHLEKTKFLNKKDWVDNFNYFYKFRWKK